MSPARAVQILIAATTAARIALALTVGLGVDESYAASVAHPIALSYFDHPPLHFWIAAAAELHRGASPLADLAVRSPFIALFAVTTWLMSLVTTRVFDARAGMYAALALNVSPVFSVSTGGWVLPDGPLMCAWLAATYCVLRVDDSACWWIGAGVAAGLALLSKYHGVLLMGGIFIYLLVAARHWLARPWPYVAALIALAMFTPVIVWNAEHQWISFAFQLGRNTEAHAPRLLALAENIGGQVALVTPWVWIPLIVSAWHARRSSPLCAILGIIPIALFTLASLGGNPGQPHWPAPGYLMLFPFLGHAASKYPLRARNWLVVSGFILASVVTAVAVLQPVEDLIDWRGIDTAGGAFVAAPSWIQAGKASWALGPDVPVVCLCTAPHQFAFTRDERDFVGRDAIIVMRPKTAVQMLPRYQPYFASITPLREMRIHGTLTVDLYLAKNFQSVFPR
ncbi:MAG TPA: glycosyltransferase family 39 protein [Gemmatimonadaceae bacterium]|nr:glycosyltransferase family 39 protein [Gemmatimonadaceae bacterium]